MRKNTLVLVILLASVALQGCSFFKWIIGDPEDDVEEVVNMSDEEIQEVIARFGGEVLDERIDDIDGFRIEPFGDGISILILPMVMNCNRYMWTQVVREWLDGEIVLDPTVFPDPPGETGKREKWKEKITTSGHIVDGAADGSGLEYPLQGNGNTFSDEPHMPNDDLGANTMKPDGRLYILEAEACVKCKNPAGPYLHCFKWFYVRIKGDGPNGTDRTYLITTGAPAAPSSEFNDAVTKWQQQ